MNVYPRDLIIYLIAPTFDAITILMIVLLVICPMIWSRDPGRRARSRTAFRMITRLLASRQAK